VKSELISPRSLLKNVESEQVTCETKASTQALRAEKFKNHEAMAKNSATSSPPFAEVATGDQSWFFFHFEMYCPDYHYRNKPV
jgi:hypothetical protein